MQSVSFSIPAGHFFFIPFFLSASWFDCLVFPYPPICAVLEVIHLSHVLYLVGTILAVDPFQIEAVTSHIDSLAMFHSIGAVNTFFHNFDPCIVLV